MGNKLSSSVNSDGGEVRLQDTFSKELHSLRDIVSKVVSAQDDFVDPRYNFLSASSCDAFVFATMKDLNKHTRIQLKDAVDTIFVIPKNESSATEKSTKKELCDLLVHHYLRILYVLCLVKHVYDLEGDGKFSLAGIVSRNVRVVDGVLEVSYCAIPQRAYAGGKALETIDFADIKGWRMFSELILDPTERKAFALEFQAALDRSASRIRASSCRDGVLTTKEREELYDRYVAERKPVVAKSCKARRAPAAPPADEVAVDVPSLLRVPADNPIMGAAFCYDARKVILPLDKSSAESKRARALLDKMRRNYSKGLKDVHALLDLVVDRSGDAVDIRDLDAVDVDGVVQKVKAIVKKFFLRTLLDYQELLDYCLSVPNIGDFARRNA
jgi:hypothetical protein